MAGTVHRVWGPSPHALGSIKLRRLCIAVGAEPRLLLLSLSARSSFLRLPATDALKEEWAAASTSNHRDTAVNA